MRFCQAIAATDSRNSDVVHRGSSLVWLWNQVSRLGFCSSKTGQARLPGKDETLNHGFRKKTEKQHVSPPQTGVGHLAFVWFPWRPQPPARTQWNSKREQRIHLYNLMMSFLWSTNLTETWVLNRGLCPSALIVQLKLPVDSATGRLIVCGIQQARGGG